MYTNYQRLQSLSVRIVLRISFKQLFFFFPTASSSSFVSFLVRLGDTSFWIRTMVTFEVLRLNDVSVSDSHTKFEQDCMKFDQRQTKNAVFSSICEKANVKVCAESGNATPLFILCKSSRPSTSASRTTAGNVSLKSREGSVFGRHFVPACNKHQVFIYLFIYSFFFNAIGGLTDVRSLILPFVRIRTR